MNRFCPYIANHWCNQDIHSNNREGKVTSHVKNLNVLNSSNIVKEDEIDGGFFEEVLPGVDEVDLAQLNISNCNDLEENVNVCRTNNINTADRKREQGLLLSPLTYFLNKSKSKWISVGLDSYANFEPVIRLMGGRGQCITLDSTMWGEFKASKDAINKAINSKTADNFMNINKLSISFIWVDNYRKVLKGSVGSDSIYLSYESLRELWKVSDVVTFRLGLLESYHFADFYYTCLDLAATFEGDLRQRLETVFNGSCTEYIAIFKELLVNGIDRVMFDFDIHQSVKASFNGDLTEKSGV